MGGGGGAGIKIQLGGILQVPLESDRARLTCGRHAHVAWGRFHLRLMCQDKLSWYIRCLKIKKMLINQSLKLFDVDF